jgi:hypothetical protein
MRRRAAQREDVTSGRVHVPVEIGKIYSRDRR